MEDVQPAYKFGNPFYEIYTESGEFLENNDNYLQISLFWIKAKTVYVCFTKDCFFAITAQFKYGNPLVSKLNITNGFKDYDGEFFLEPKLVNLGVKAIKFSFKMHPDSEILMLDNSFKAEICFDSELVNSLFNQD